jgi:hypothetical protein
MLYLFLLFLNFCFSRSKLPLKSLLVLREYFMSHWTNPFPSEQEKNELAERGEIQVKQVTNCKEMKQEQQ